MGYGTHMRDPLPGAVERAEIIIALKAYVSANAITQKEIAVLTGVTQAAVSNYLAGKRDMSLQAFLNFCHGFGLRPEAVIVAARERRPL